MTEAEMPTSRVGRAASTGRGSPGAGGSTITVSELAEARAAGRPIQLVDVREVWESQIARLTGSTLIPLGELGIRAGELDSDAPTVLYCHVGARSDYGSRVLSSLGFTDVRSLRGGIDEWSRTVDPSVPRY